MINLNSVLQRKALLLTILLIILGAIVGMVSVQFAPINVDVQMRTHEKGNFQYFYDIGDGFNEADSKVIELSQSPKFTHYNFYVRAFELASIRIDPIESQGKFEIFDIKIGYLFWSREWIGFNELSDLLNARNVDLYPNETVLFAGQAINTDPNLIITGLQFLQSWRMMATIMAAIIGSLVALSIAGTFRYLAKRNIFLPLRYIPLILIILIGAWLRLSFWAQSDLASEVVKINPGFDEKTYFSIGKRPANTG